MFLEVCLGMYLTLAHVPRHVPRNVPETLHALDTFHEKYLDIYQKSTSHDVPGGVLRSVLGTVHALSMCWTWMYLEMSVEVRLEMYLKSPYTIYFVFVQELSRTRPLLYGFSSGNCTKLQ